ncbi:hypothetical protein BAY1663_05059 [Pseudomonas sp. BAY1663]|nr:hypothetical protein BAY1663_05059 [Pseudomonas sp. BAY1663]
MPGTRADGDEPHRFGRVQRALHADEHRPAVPGNGRWRRPGRQRPEHRQTAPWQPQAPALPLRSAAPRPRPRRRRAAAVRPAGQHHAVRPPTGLRRAGGAHAEPQRRAGGGPDPGGAGRRRRHPAAGLRRQPGLLQRRAPAGVAGRIVRTARPLAGGTRGAARQAARSLDGRLPISPAAERAACRAGAAERGAQRAGGDPQPRRTPTGTYRAVSGRAPAELCRAAGARRGNRRGVGGAGRAARRAGRGDARAFARGDPRPARRTAGWRRLRAAGCRAAGRAAETDLRHRAAGAGDHRGGLPPSPGGQLHRADPVARPARQPCAPACAAQRRGGGLPDVHLRLHRHAEGRGDQPSRAGSFQRGGAPALRRDGGRPHAAVRTVQLRCEHRGSLRQPRRRRDPGAAYR